MFTTGFARDLAERTIATFAEALAALLIADGLGVLETDWVAMLSAAGATALIAMLKGVAAYKLGDNATGASLLADPPPRVERGATDLVFVLVVVVLVLVVLALVGVL